jgi:hypothetical protein
MAATSGLCKVSGRVLKIGTSSSMEEIVLPDTVDFSQFEKGIVALPGDDNPITRLTREYGETPFYSSVAAVNAFFSRAEVRALINEADQPILHRRIQTETIFTPIEVANFTIGTGYTPFSLSVATSVVSLNFVNQFESFYTQNFTQSTIGSFCSILPNVFGAVGVFFIGLQALDTTIQSLKNFALNFSLSALLSRLKNSVLSIIDKVVAQAKSIIENLSLASVSSKILQLVAKINESIYENFQVIKTSALSFFDKENVDNYKSGVEKLIDYAMSIFKSPTIQEVQFLLYRFCSFAALIENSISALKNPVESYINSYAETISILQSSSSRNTARAIAAGAIRYDIQVRRTGINIGNELYEQAGNPPLLTAEDYEDITPWNNGRGDSRITFVGGSFSDPMVGRDGWDKINPRAKTQLMRVQREFGRKLELVSGYRSREYNDALRRRGVGAARNSLHISGLAMDVRWAGFNRQSMEEFIDIALRNGFTGIGRYSSFVHIDIGPRREWRG